MPPLISSSFVAIWDSLRRIRITNVMWPYVPQTTPECDWLTPVPLMIQSPRTHVNPCVNTHSFTSMDSLSQAGNHQDLGGGRNRKTWRKPTGELVKKLHTGGTQSSGLLRGQLGYEAKCQQFSPFSLFSSSYWQPCGLYCYMRSFSPQRGMSNTPYSVTDLTQECLSCFDKRLHALDLSLSPALTRCVCDRFLISRRGYVIQHTERQLWPLTGLSLSDGSIRLFLPHYLVTLYRSMTELAHLQLNSRGKPTPHLSM